MLRGRALILVMVVVLGMPAFVFSNDSDPWNKAEQNATAAREAFLKCWRYVHGWLQHADPTSGLLPRNLTVSPFWNAKDAAADNYPFMVLSCYFTDRSLFNGRMKDILAAEQRLCNRVGRLPDDWVFASQSFRVSEPNIEDLVFGAAEYSKDGLLPLTEYLGPSAWSNRMLDLVEDIWKYGSKPSEVGPIPATSHEVAGDLLQVLTRMYWMTRNPVLKEQAFRLGDYFLLHHLPTGEDFLRLDDHGCEVVNGLSEAYYLAAREDPDRHQRWHTPMHRMLDRILEVARDENGLLFSKVNPKTGEKLTDDRTDNWGYNYNAFLVVFQVDGVERYREAVAFVLRQLLKVKDYPWESDRADGLADSLEGGLNLINRMPIPEAVEWADYIASKLLAKQQDTGVIEGWHGDGNFARTALMWALWKTQGTFVEPWRADLRLGASQDPDGTVYLYLAADWPWAGTVRFDIPRHKEYLKIPSEYPRLNQFPEWFVVSPDQSYQVDSAVMKGHDLRQGLRVQVTPDQPWRIRIRQTTD